MISCAFHAYGGCSLTISGRANLRGARELAHGAAADRAGVNPARATVWGFAQRRLPLTALLFLQVCGVHGSWHLGQLQIGLSQPVKLAQCRHARITLLETIPVQMDGEPWRQAPATLDISLRGQVRQLWAPDRNGRAPSPALACASECALSSLRTEIAQRACVCDAARTIPLRCQQERMR